ncbi:MAG: hypothetical protein EBR29_07295, partial [Sphingobacteriia bacterium]|nr:hypothetical protein [Sphingobacteriia bacterium]
DLLVVAKPSTYFSDWARYKLDHFVMRGGRILWYRYSNRSRAYQKGVVNIFGS